MNELDPRWEWHTVETFGGSVVRHIKGHCRHLDTVAVISGDETVAHLCLTCDAQLPAEWTAS